MPRLHCAKNADRERRLEGLAVAVLTALGEHDGAVRDAERRRRGAADDERKPNAPIPYLAIF